MSEELNTTAANTNTTEVQQVATDNVTETQPVMVEENNLESNATQNDTVPIGADTTTDNDNVEEKTQPSTDELDALKAKIKEYELRDEEIKALSQRLQTDQIGDVRIMQAQTHLDMVNNQAAQDYINICNKYGVDYRPENIETSSQELMKNNPRAFVELQFELNSLNNVVTNKRNEIQDYIQQTQVQNALSQYKDVLQASPAMNNAINAYLKDAYIEDPKGTIEAFMQLATPLYREAFEYGRALAQQEAVNSVTVNPADELNSSSITNQTNFPTTQQKVFTRQEIANMSQKDFERYEKEIDRQMRAGLIQ